MGKEPWSLYLSLSPPKPHMHARTHTHTPTQRHTHTRAHTATTSPPPPPHTAQSAHLDHERRSVWRRDGGGRQHEVRGRRAGGGGVGLDVVQHGCRGEAGEQAAAGGWRWRVVVVGQWVQRGGGGAGDCARVPAALAWSAARLLPPLLRAAWQALLG